MRELGSVRRWVDRLTEAVFFIPLILLVLLGVVWVSTLNLVHTEYTASRQNALTLGRELLQTYEAQVLRALREIDQSLKIVKYAYETHQHEDTLAALNTKDLLPPAVIFTACLLDNTGKIISSTGLDESCINDPHLFAELRQSDGLVINTPRQPSNTQPLMFGRRLDENSGAFAGAVIIAVEPAYLVSGYETQKFGMQGLNGLIGNDGIFRVLRVGDTISTGQKPLSDTTFEEAHNDSLQEYQDGINRYTFSRPLFGYPLTAVVALSEVEQMSAAKRTANLYYSRAAGGSLLLIIIFAALFRESWLLAQSRKREQEHALAYAAQIEHLAYHDTLTGLPNRGLFNKLLQQELMLAKRNNRIISLFFLDLDRFKHINDTLGHDVGDELLIQVAQRIKGALRESDIVARLGGDEFVAILPNQKEPACAEAVAKKIIDAVAQPYHIMRHEFSITASIGISMYPHDGEDEVTLMKNADIAMYYAKTHGKNKYQLYSADLPVEQEA